MKKKGFTLLEIIIATTLLFLLMVSVMEAYSGILRFKYIFQAKANMIENTYYMMEKINVLLKDYVVDYDEYFNRGRVGCDSGYQSNFSWNVSTNGHCDNFTFYGNGNGYLSSKSGYNLYYCSSITGYLLNNEYVIETLPGFTTGCLSTGYQSFGQYAFQFYDQRRDADGDNSVVKDSDDIYIGKGPEAILNTTGVQELYLISPDRKNRIFLRRSLMGSGDWDKSGGQPSGDNELWYTIQILKLKAFDAGSLHNFDPLTSSGVYDGKTDTWACDYSQGFICNGTGLGNLYSGYRLPTSSDDGWINIFDKNLTVANWNLNVYPNKNPDFSWAEDVSQINPYFTISLKTKLYGEVWQHRLAEALGGFEFALQTTFNIKDNYTKQ